MRMRSGLVSLLLLASLSCARKTPPAVPDGGGAGTPVTHAEPEPKNRLPGDVRPLAYAIDLRVTPESERFDGKVRISLELTRPRRVLWLHGRDLSVRDVRLTVGSQEIGARYREVDPHGLARVDLTSEAPAGRAQLAFTYDAPLVKKPRGLFRITDGADAYAFTQFEPLDARRCFPSLDEPAFKVPFDISLTIKKEHNAVANSGALREEPLPGGWKRVTFRRTEKLPTYLIAIAVGPFDVVPAAAIPPNPIRSRALPLRGVAPRGKARKLEIALSWAPAIVERLERYFGIAYPYDKLDLVGVPGLGLAMENAGLITFTEQALLIDPQSAPVSQLRGVASVLTHELAHQWFGDLVTMPWWDDIWLNEAFATWMAFRTVHAWRPAYRADVAEWGSMAGAMRADALVAARQIRQPIESTHDIHNAFDSITYSKGGGVLSMFERYLGADVFRRRIHDHLEKHRFGHATSDEFVEAIATGGPADVAAAFRSFLLQPGVPLIEARVACANGRGTATLRQSRYLPLGSKGDARLRWRVPVCLRYDAGGVREKCVLLSAAEEQVALGGCPVWLHPNAGGAGYYRFALPPEEYAKLTGPVFAKLAVREQLALADGIYAAFFSGRLPAENALRLLAPLASSPERAVAKTPMFLLELSREALVPPEMRPRVESLARSLYAGVLGKIGLRRQAGENEERTLLRKDVIEFLLETGRDPALQRELARQADAYIGKDGQVRKDAVDPDLVGPTLEAGVEELGEPFVDRLLALRKRTRDEMLRSHIVRAIFKATRPALAERARGLILSELRSDEIGRALFSQAGQLENRDGLWKWLTENFDRLLPRTTEGTRGYLPIVAGLGACSSAKAAEVERFFSQRIQLLVGGPRNLRGAIERAEVCAATVGAQRESAKKFFER
jgi:alanyl aminopeptidase